jgi:hypothetical protein
LYPALLVAQTAEEALQYQIGDRARESVIATETIRITDPEKHPDVFTEVRNTIPPIYGYSKIASSESAVQLTKSWNNTRDDFLNSLQRVFGKRTFRTVEISSEPFDSFIDSYQAGNQGFPFTDGLARRWAAGNLATNDLEGHSARLDVFMTAYFIRSDESPNSQGSNIVKIDLITLGAKDPKNLEEMAKHPVAQIALRQFIPVSQAREIFLRQSNLQNRALKVFLSRFVQPNTKYMEALSIERWESAQESLKNEIVFERGDVIVRKGEEITEVVKEALNLMIVGLRYSRLKDSVKIELAKEPGSPLNNRVSAPRQVETPKAAPTTPANQPATRETIEERPEGKLPPILSPTTVAQSNRASGDSINAKPANSDTSNTGSSLASVSSNNSHTGIDSLYLWLIALVTIIVSGLLVFLHFQKSPPVYVREAEQLATVDDRKQNLLKTLTSQLTQTLFRQRQILLRSKESATAQVAAMENRLAKLQPEIFDKLQAYEEKIRNLEEQLEHQNSSIENLNKPLLEDDDELVTRPIFEDLNGSAEGEENLDPIVADGNTNGGDKELPFPGNAIPDESDEEEPSDLLEEVLEDLEAEENFDRQIAKGSEH